MKIFITAFLLILTCVSAYASPADQMMFEMYQREQCDARGLAYYDYTDPKSGGWVSAGGKCYRRASKEEIASWPDPWLVRLFKGGK